MAGFLPGPHSDPSDPLVVRAYTLTIQAPEGSGSVWPEPGTYKYLEDMMQLFRLLLILVALSSMAAIGQ